MQATATIFFLPLHHSHDNLYPIAFGSKSHVKIVVSIELRAEEGVPGNEAIYCRSIRAFFTRARVKTFWAWFDLLRACAGYATLLAKF